MSVKQVDRSRWKAFFDLLTNIPAGKRAELEVTSAGPGDRPGAEWQPLIGILYDPASDVIEVAFEGRDHLILKPRDVYVDFNPDGLTGLGVVDGAGVCHIVKLRDPITLGAPRPAATAAGAQ